MLERNTKVNNDYQCWLGHQTCKTSSPQWPKLCLVGR